MIVPYRWQVLIACSAATCWGAGVYFYGLTTFFNPVLEEFKWSATVTSLVFSLRAAESGAAAPLVGFLIDRFGPRRVMLMGNITCGVGFLMMSRIQGLLEFYMAGLVLALGASGAFGIVGMAAVSSWFERKRSMALGILMSGVGASGAIVPLIHWAIETYGWRAAFLMAGLSMWCIGVPLSLLVRDAPEKYGMLPNGELPPETAEEASPGWQKHGIGEAPKPRPAQGVEWRPMAVLRIPAFWLISAAMALSMAGFQAIVALNFPYLTGIGIAPETAGLVVLGMTVTSVLGRLGFGWLGDKMDKRRVLAVLFTLQCIGGLIFSAARKPWHLAVFIATFAPAYGGQIPLRPAIQAEFFGMRSFGTIQGIMIVLTTVGSIISPVFAAWIFDTRGSYRLAFMLLAMGSLTAVPMILSAKRPTADASF